MGREELIERIAAATVHVDGMVDRLQTGSSEAMQDCTGQIESACRDLAGAFASPDLCGDVRALAAALHLRGKICRARRLLENLCRFHEHLGSMIGARIGGYLPGGQAAPLATAERVSLRG